MNKGILHGILAYALWGLFPIFWRELHHVEAFQIVGHRIVWSFVMLFGVSVFIQRKSISDLVPTKSHFKTYAVASFLIGINWFLYVWAVNSGHVLESSLGYFINPFFSVLFGILFYKETLRTGQFLALVLAAAGVLYLTFAVGSVPWIALTLAVSFGLYGAVKKSALLPPVQGLLLETACMLIPAFLFLVFRETEGKGDFLHTDGYTNLLLVGAGMVTTLPLLLFASAAQKIPMSMLGFLQYLSPTLQFLCGILIFKEEFSSTKLIGYGLVWLSLALFAAEGIRFRRMSSKFKAESSKG
jgi:chloramphenicol-sensitive protein RarD